MKSPDRIPLGRRTADILEQEILNQRWTKQLPGYRELCARMGVSRRTMETALQILTRREIILPAEGKKARLINPDLAKLNAPSPSERKSLLIYSPKALQDLDVVVRKILEKVTQRFNKKGWSIEFHHNSEFAKGKPGLITERLQRDCPNHRWILILPKYEMIQWCMEKQLRIICLGGEPVELRPPLVAVCYSSLLSSAADNLIKLGHRRLSILLTNTSNNGRDKIANHLKSTLTKHQIHFHSNYHLPHIEHDNVQSHWECLSKLFAVSPPTALIATEPQQISTVYSFCMSKGIRIPQDLSFIIVKECDNLSWFCPTPAHYIFPVAEFVRQICQWVENYPTNIDGHNLLEAKLEPGSSIAPISSALQNK
ncbi:DNA-binding transcriptional regulator, LacI/PurR family [Rubritalea squalenifaciens DSM 18772]|uniref:DNA-binding transcriptional regulator, LacI/PurR family n=1 Tax=Rubritalea squalenifaciens DSM 18772 TaxID=1123071 RepID=A0A1M6QWG4_9BACT|nr:substrate-binding domain-containing protein [Rubritalea squalenifaciens]SHK24417.1 DNA-binding transcriptional regulator, LacI/PurR family [Rubritalea squalenifaciens DSM 18772]